MRPVRWQAPGVRCTRSRETVDRIVKESFHTWVGTSLLIRAGKAGIITVQAAERVARVEEPVAVQPFAAAWSLIEYNFQSVVVTDSLCLVLFRVSDSLAGLQCKALT